MEEVSASDDSLGGDAVEDGTGDSDLDGEGPEVGMMGAAWSATSDDDSVAGMLDMAATNEALREKNRRLQDQVCATGRCGVGAAHELVLYRSSSCTHS